MIDKIKHYPVGKNGLKIYFKGYSYSEKYISLNHSTVLNKSVGLFYIKHNTDIKPILRPLEKFCRTSTTQGVKELGQMFSLYGLDGIRWGEAKFLLDNFVDIFNLIDQDKAVAYDPEKHNKCYE